MIIFVSIHKVIETQWCFWSLFLLQKWGHIMYYHHWCLLKEEPCHKSAFRYRIRLYLILHTWYTIKHRFKETKGKLHSAKHRCFFFKLPKCWWKLKTTNVKFLSKLALSYTTTIIAIDCNSYWRALRLLIYQLCSVFYFITIVLTINIEVHIRECQTELISL